MLRSLAVSNLGVVEFASLEFGEGMTAFTGETGAGKTLLVEALHLVLGGRADLGLVRPGAAEAVVDATFEHGGAVRRLRRIVPVTGRSRAEVDGVVVPVAELRELGETLVAIHGQHDAQRLFEPTAARDALDTFGGIDRAPVERCRASVRALESALARLGGDAAQAAQAHQQLVDEHDELTAAAIVGPEELDSLVVEFERLSDAEGALEALGLASGLLLGDDDNVGVSGAVAAVVRALAGRPQLAAASDAAAGIGEDLAVLATTLRDLVDLYDVDPGRLDAVGQRIRLLRALARRYGGDLQGVLDARDRLAHALDDAERIGQDRETIEANLSLARAALDEAEAALRLEREAVAPALGAAVEARLATLHMASARFVVLVGDDPAGDEVAFAFSANAGMRPQELTKVASGGELSRVMLALHLAVPNGPPVLIFDEVDAGVGGQAATALGRLLAELSREVMVLVVTHLPQVAALAGTQFRIAKFDDGRTTRTDVVALAGDARVVELARMLSGSPDSAVAQAHARELLERW